MIPGMEGVTSGVLGVLWQCVPWPGSGDQRRSGYLLQMNELVQGLGFPPIRQKESLTKVGCAAETPSGAKALLILGRLRHD